MDAPSKTPSAILFDLDDTIIAFDVLRDECWKNTLNEFSGSFQPDTIEEVLSAILKESDFFWSDPQRHALWRMDLQKGRRRVVELAFESVGLKDLALSRRVADRFSELKDATIRLFPQALDTLKLLRSKGIRLALVTNGSAQSQRAKIERFGLGDYFDAILIEGEMGFGKPDNRIYLTALSMLGVDCKDAWMVGDNLLFDVLQPQSLGIRGVWIDNKNTDPLNRKFPGNPHITAKSIVEVLPHLA